MAKIIKVTDTEVSIAQDDSTIIKVPRASLEFEPSNGTLVEVYDTGEEVIVHLAESKKIADNLQDKININIVNENNNQQTQQQVVYAAGAGRWVNKWVYALLALFFGGLGAHHFYAGKIGTGFMYLLFSWTFIPALIGFFQGISAMLRQADTNGNILV
ncbi:hypothetical protein STRDD10_00398 [Streptococcus sp. DD10]|uniref:TM2 domain-containing protein n=1 Tax=Streptococcus sp. DD10 TaxID=1777878 RepID=UPI00079C5247|nr:TM2 domain-containing protein [Streptococcus sp. DD10]KXT75196.1 hypothetical protein STRDD10_00398 [Streptococcus sp. DD10]